MTTYNSSSITREATARLGIYPTKVCGVVNFASTVKLATNDLINLCYIPINGFLAGIYISVPILDNGATPALVMSLQDSLAAATTYILLSSKGTNFSIATNFVFADFAQATIGTMYGTTARTIGATGAAVVVFAGKPTLQFKVTTGAFNTIGGTGANLIYMIDWAPSYDMGS